jgi:asparagine synthase (glutamine-hydrolysing)
MFARDGTLRWLAKELAKGVMPERQRANLLNGRWDSDWQLRLQRKRREYLDELDRIARDPRLSAMVDVPRLRRALEAMPQITPTDRQTVLPLEMAIPRGILAARFIRYAEGRNET